MHKVVINGKDLSEDFIIGKVSYPTFSVKNNFIERAGKTPAFFNDFSEQKPIEITFTKRDGYCEDPIKVQHDLELFIAKNLRTKEPVWIEVDGRFFYGKLEKTSEELYKGEIVATFINIDGKWYSEEKKVDLGEPFIVSGIESTSKAIIKGIARKSSGKIGELNLSNMVSNYKILVDLDEKIVRQGDYAPEIALNSDFFKLKVGENKIEATNVDGVIKYREVIAL